MCVCKWFLILMSERRSRYPPRLFCGLINIFDEMNYTRLGKEHLHVYKKAIFK